MTSVREAARAVLADWDDGNRHTLGQVIAELRAACDAPPPGLEEVRRKLRELWASAASGLAYMGAEDERDRLIADLLALFEDQLGRSEDRQKDRQKL